MRTVTTVYEVVSARRSRRGKCPACGRTVTRSRTFEQTVNPWNKGPDGIPKTYEEVQSAVNAEADLWVPDFTHGGCNDA